MRLAIALCATFFSFTTHAETRFMNLSAETVGGRCVLTDAGGIYVFHADGRYEAKTISGRYQRAQWSLAWGKIIRITFKNGETADFNSFKVDGEARIGIVSKHGSRKHKVTDILPEASPGCDVRAAGATNRPATAAGRIPRVVRRNTRDIE
ncbi:hypothetical protein J2Y55_004608 [Bosea sp. BE125]|uniref:hypothetical protein n=1 Tax=Bosea sp. BE125 TaxID=2817909 RepID=UPI002866AF1E|nr:hypothetical protein [Bosea sp. BE125]MDR6873581.1 hypothetical protein [Bosea sp. BE125]